MDIDKYFSEVREKIAKLSDDEFKQLLLDSGLEKCPFEQDLVSVFWEGSISLEQRDLVSAASLQNSNFSLLKQRCIPFAFEQNVTVNYIPIQDFWSYSLQNGRLNCISNCNVIQFAA